MKKILFLQALVLASYFAGAQCMVSTLTINTGYDPSTGFAITPGINGGTPVHDPHWIITNESPSVAVAIGGTGLIEVVPGNLADIITAEGSWAVNPALQFGGWLSCINSNTYTTDGTGPTGTPYYQTFGRPFRMCTDDSVTFDFYIADDNYLPATDIDGTPLTFSQPAIDNPAFFESFAHYTQTVYLTAGVHTFHAVVNNYNDNSVESNPTGMDIYGTVSSATGTNSLVYEGDPACGTYICGVVPNICNAISMPDTITKCRGDSVVIPAVISGTDTVLSLLWYSATGLSSTSILDPTYYYGATSAWKHVVMASINPTNLIVNGSFTYGNSGFNSSYPYVTGTGSLVPEGVYTCTTDPHIEHSGAASFGDHTTGTGDMMAINGASTPIDVWCETIDVAPHTTYYLSAWFANWSSDTADNLPIIQFKINGVLLGTPFIFPHPDGLWTEFTATWNSGTSSIATICIYDQQTAADGNDFAIDDIAFKPVCMDTDSIYLNSQIPDTVYRSNVDSACLSAGPVSLAAPAGYTNYFWSDGSSGASLTEGVSGTYWVYCTIGCNVLVDTFHLIFIAPPTVLIGDDTSFCAGMMETLKSAQPSENTFLWSNGATVDSIVVGATGTYWLQVTTPPGCTAADTVHVYVAAIPVVNLGPDVFTCTSGPVPLSSPIIYSGGTYFWSDGSAGITDTAFVSGTYWLQITDTGCSSADTINVTIKFDTLTLLTPDTAICAGNSVHVRATANPAITCQWIPTAGIAISNVLAPIINPDTSAEYVLTGAMAGCPDIVDSFFLDVQPNPLVYIGGGRSVCQYDTLHLPVSVTPGWYGHYSFLWTITPVGQLDVTTPSVAVFTAGVSSEVVLSVSTPAGCEESDSAQIIVRPGDFAAGDTSVTLCPGDSIQLTPSGGVSYLWRPGTYLSDSTVAQPWVRAINNEAYTIQATSAYGCKDTVYIKVSVLPAAVITLGDSVTIYNGESYQINTQTNCEKFWWFPPDGLSSAGISNPLATPQISTKYTVLATTSWGCSVLDSISIFVDNGAVLAVPNAFTPGATVNSILKVIRRGEATLGYFRIFDRWGNKVFETENIDAGWDGTFNGQPQPMGVYIYELQATAADGTAFQKSGNITLLR